MKKIILFLLFFVSSAALADAGSLYNYPYLYKGMRSIGMGGTFTAVGSDPEALFYNPAGLYDMGFQLAVLNPLIEVDQNLQSLAGDIQTAGNKGTEAERIDSLTDVISKNMGKPLHGRLSLFPHLAMKNYAVGVVGNGIFDARLHNPLGSQGAVEVNSGYEYGPVAGGSFILPVKGLRMGIGAKYISSSWLDEGFTIRQIASENFKPMDSAINKTDFSLDVGFLYDIDTSIIEILKPIEFLKPKAGLSILNITDLDFRESGKGRMIPMTANIGISVNPALFNLVDTLFLFDYQDITGKYEQDKSIWKRVHLGAELGLLSRRVFLRAGLNQGYPSIGAELNIGILRLGYVYYTEEIGAYAGQDKNTRHLLQLSLGWY